jgi:hypothetical protein
MNTKLQIINSVVIDNCVVLQSSYGISICPINLARKIYPTLNIDSLDKITYDNREKANHIISQLAYGCLKFEDLIR